MIGWIDGTAYETLPMSVEKRVISRASDRTAPPVSMNVRPSDLEIGAVEPGQVGVVDHVRVDDLLLARRARRRSPWRPPRSSAAPSRAARPAAPRSRRGSSTCPRVRAGMMFGASPPTETMPCTLSVGSNAWRSSPMATCATTIRVGGVHATLGERAGVRGHARVRHVDRLRGQHLGKQLVVRSGMDHERGMDSLEHARVEEDLLPGAALFGRRARSPSHAVRAVCHGRQRNGRADGRGRDHVVPARVPDLGQRVVLDEHRDVQRPRPDTCQAPPSPVRRLRESSRIRPSRATRQPSRQPCARRSSARDWRGSSATARSGPRGRARPARARRAWVQSGPSGRIVGSGT